MANRQYKDTVFRTYFNHAREIAQLYQAIRLEDVIRPEDITITTIDDVFLSARKNDLSFLWKDQAIVLAEQQSSINQNMPYRMFLYSAFQLLANLVDSKKLYGTKPVALPAPHYYMLYLGDDMQADEDTLTLSSLFREKPADLELTCHVYNITYKKNRAILERCRPLREYSFFVHQIDVNKKAGFPLLEAIRAAVLYCMEHGIMKEFLEAHREEVVQMIALQWDAEEEKKVLQDESRAEGVAMATLKFIRKQLQRKVPYEQIAEDTETPIDEVLRIAKESHLAY
ncbi:hypothetical protein [Selenomonas sp.]|uniref:hypothetical protein n=2 Tax=Selenomonas sp. TaxID=2053611 RepID=UPI0025E5730C|nr:hypothetical protein [Selenomonas sp.]MCI6086862.1 hypothetical protein [Selenomonas sp.]MDY3298155.1 hypothetical protein [Selenomonas sp.]